MSHMYVETGLQYPTCTWRQDYSVPRVHGDRTTVSHVYVETGLQCPTCTWRQDYSVPRVHGGRITEQDIVEESEEDMNSGLYKV